MKHFKWDEIEGEQLNEKFFRKLTWDGSLMMARTECKQGCIVPAHSHANEQITFVVSGRWRFVMEGRTFDVGPNELVYIPPNVEHMAEAVEDVLAYDIFTPPREDWLTGQDAYLRDTVAEPPQESASVLEQLKG
jgi:quercetin dioxygenase-like cupin family protein